MEKVIPGKLQEIEKGADKPLANEVLTGIKDEGLASFLNSAIPRFKYRDGNLVVEHETVLDILPEMYANFGLDLPLNRMNLAGSFSQRTNCLRDTGLYKRDVYPNSPKRRLTRYVTDDDSMINAISYLFIKQREEMGSRSPLMIYEALSKTARAFGEDHPRAAFFMEASNFLERKHERTKAKHRPHKQRYGAYRDEDSDEERVYFVWTKHYLEKEDITLEDKLMSIDAKTIDEILGFVHYHEEIFNNSSTKRQYAYEDFGIDSEVGRVFEFIRRANNNEKIAKAFDGFDINNLKNGLVIARGYLKKYPNIVNIYVLVSAIQSAQK